MGCLNLWVHYKIQQEPSKMFDLIRKDVKETIGNYISGLLDLELKGHLKRDKYERSDEIDPNCQRQSKSVPHRQS